MCELCDKLRDAEIEAFHRSTIVVDFHNDFLEEKRNKPEGLLSGNNLFQTDIPRLKSGGVDVQFFVVWTRPKPENDNPLLTGKQMVETLKAELAANVESIELAKSSVDIEAALAKKKIAAVLAVEGGYIIDNKLENLDWFYNEGARYLTLTWNYGCDWIGGANENGKRLTAFGKEVIDRLHKLGMIVDLSHVNHQSVDDVLSYTDKTVVATHSGAYAVHAHQRNLTDDHIKEIARRGGVVGAVFYPPFLNGTDKATVADVVKHINHVRKVTNGVDAIAVGSDFDGIDITPERLNDVSSFPNLTKALFAEGYSPQEVEQIMGKNILRVFKQICG